MAFTQAQVDAIDSAIAQGVRSVTYDGKTVTYNTVDDMLKARNMMRDAIAKAAGTATARGSFAQFSKF